MKELMKKYKEIEGKRNAIAGRNSESREKLRALKADDDRHEAAIKELEKEKQKTLYIDLGQVEKKIQIHEKAREELMDKIGDAEFSVSGFKRQLNQKVNEYKAKHGCKNSEAVKAMVKAFPDLHRGYIKEINAANG